MELGKTSQQKLKGVHDDLVRVVSEAARLTKVPFIVTEGTRTLARQKELLALGATRTLKSRHLTGHAVDLAPLDPVTGQVRWDWPLFYVLADAMKAAAKKCAVPIEWGGDWRTFKDGPHFQLPKKEFPA